MSSYTVGYNNRNASWLWLEFKLLLFDKRLKKEIYKSFVNLTDVVSSRGMRGVQSVT